MVNDTRADYDHLMTESDEALCASVRAGNRLAEEVLAARYHRLVRSCARPYFLAGGDSEDLLQEGMFGLHQGHPGVRSGHTAPRSTPLPRPASATGCTRCCQGRTSGETRTAEPRSSP